jgi:non-ribosomal peptide synthetase component F
LCKLEGGYGTADHRARLEKKVEHDRSPTRHINEVPEARSAIQAKCVHPSGGFAEFTQDEIEQSISNRFEKIALLHARIAVKSGDRCVTYDELNRIANRVAQALLLRFGMDDERIVLLLDHDAPLVAARSWTLSAKVLGEGRLDGIGG